MPLMYVPLLALAAFMILVALFWDADDGSEDDADPA